jgi:hypothetical protein
VHDDQEAAADFVLADLAEELEAQPQMGDDQ